MREELLEYYERELAYLRQLGGKFAEKYPRVASRLLLEPDRCDDPHVERLLEAFAFMAARVHLRIDDDFPEVTSALLGIVAPHYLPAHSIDDGGRVPGGSGKGKADRGADDSSRNLDWRPSAWWMGSHAASARRIRWTCGPSQCRSASGGSRSGFQSRFACRARWEYCGCGWSARAMCSSTSSIRKRWCFILPVSRMWCTPCMSCCAGIAFRSWCAIRNSAAARR